MIRPPFERWHAFVALGGFATIAIKGRIWEELGNLGEYALKQKFILFAILAGVLVSAMTIVRPEEVD